MGKCFDQSICREFLVRATDRAAVIEVLEAYAFAKALKGVGSAGVQQKFCTHPSRFLSEGDRGLSNWAPRLPHTVSERRWWTTDSRKVRRRISDRPSESA